jgi:hypothetical protein
MLTTMHATQTKVQFYIILITNDINISMNGRENLDTNFTAKCMKSKALDKKKNKVWCLGMGNYD